MRIHERVAVSVLRRQLRRGPLPRHVGVVMDGNRRWARQAGFDDASVGHRYGAEHVEPLLRWCADAGVRHVTVFVASAANLAKRDAAEIAHLMSLVEEVVATRLLEPGSRWQVHVAGRLDLLPPTTAAALRRAEETTRDRENHVTVAIGYDGRQEVVHAVRSLLTQGAGTGATLAELAGTVTEAEIGSRLYTAGQPEPDLIIRTSGERRMNGFLLWQSTRSELFFCDVYWPGFGQADLLRALRDYRRRLAAA